MQRTVYDKNPSGTGNAGKITEYFLDPIHPEYVPRTDRKTGWRWISVLAE